MNIGDILGYIFGLFGCWIIVNSFFALFNISKCKTRQIEIEEDKLRAAQETNQLLKDIQKELHKHNELLEKKDTNTNSRHTNK